MVERADSAPNVAVFCDFENVAIGARDAGYDSFDIALVLERILDKGKIVLKKAYCDWDRYKNAKRPMHEAGFELIEIPHVSYSGKNSADIRLVVDALDLSYTKGHVEVFVIVSGDSDFSALAAKLRENDKAVIGVGVKGSSGDLLIESCDEFIYYDDLVRGKKASRQKSARPRGTSLKDASKEPTSTKESSKEPSRESSRQKASKKDERSEMQSDRVGDKDEALELVLETVEALFRDREDNLWGSMVKQTIKRKRPNFSESYYGYRTFNHLLEDAAAQELLEIIKDEKSGGYIIRAFGPRA